MKQPKRYVALRCIFCGKNASTVFRENSTCAAVVAMHSLLPIWVKGGRGRSPQVRRVLPRNRPPAMASARHIATCQFNLPGRTVKAENLKAVRREFARNRDTRTAAEIEDPRVSGWKRDQLAEPAVTHCRVGIAA
jgi:hypothetical protein